MECARTTSCFLLNTEYFRIVVSEIEKKTLEQTIYRPLLFLYLIIVIPLTLCHRLLVFQQQQIAEPNTIVTQHSTTLRIHSHFLSADIRKFSSLPLRVLRLRLLNSWSKVSFCSYFYGSHTYLNTYNFRLITAV